ncbi:MAG: hypothetical protein AVDCRST_MAG26-1498, partial [uncultured Chloroflexia bacterium]
WQNALNAGKARRLAIRLALVLATPDDASTRTSRRLRLSKATRRRRSSSARAACVRHPKAS